MKLIPIIKNNSCFIGFLVGTGKIIMAILSHSWLMFIHAVYNIIKASAKHYALKERKGHYNTCLLYTSICQGVFSEKCISEIFMDKIN